MSAGRPVLFRCFALMLLTAIVLPGCGGGGGGGGGGTAADTTPPVITGAQAVTPIGWDFLGGIVTIQATITDNVGVASASATVTKPDSTTAPVTLTAVGSAYSGSFTAPANMGTGAVTYSVVVTATDTSGNPASSAAFTFQVPDSSSSLPPPPPTLGR